MTEIERMQYARQYLRVMAQGIHPIRKTPVSETDLVRDPHIVNCLNYVSDILLACIQERQAAQQSPQPAKPEPPAAQPVPSPAPAAEEYRSQEQAAPRSAKSLALLTDEQKAAFLYCDEPIALRAVMQEINRYHHVNQTARLSEKAVRRWLRSVGILEQADGRDTVTDAGREIGLITAPHRTPNGTADSHVIKYDRNAQQFLVDNLDAILAYQDSFFLTDEQLAQLTLAPERSVSEIAAELNRFCDENGTSKLKTTRITEWLCAQGILEQIGTNKRPTEQGAALGITERERTSERDGRTFMQTFYNEEAQKYIFAHLDDILG